MAVNLWERLVTLILTICFSNIYPIFAISACHTFTRHGLAFGDDPFGAASNWWTTASFFFGWVFCFVFQWVWRSVFPSDIMEAGPATTRTSAESANTEKLTAERRPFLSALCKIAFVICTVKDLMIFLFVFPFWSIVTVCKHPDVHTRSMAKGLQSLMVYAYWMASFSFGDRKFFSLSTWIAVVSSWIYMVIGTWWFLYWCLTPSEEKEDDDDDKMEEFLNETRITVGEESDSDLSILSQRDFDIIVERVMEI